MSELEQDCIVCGDSAIVMSELPDGCIDLTVTSPPYDNLRKYNGYVFDFESIAKELYRVTKDGGVVVWVVGDATVKGSESGTSFRQALFFMGLGFNLHDTMIYTKGGNGSTGSNQSYWQDFEYMFVLSKGKLKTFNPIEDRKNKVKPSCKIQSQGHRYDDGTTKEKRLITRKEFGRRFNVWQYHEAGTRTSHPAVFPESLATDHILSWSNEGDWVLDPFNGSGTTTAMAKKLRRHFIGIDISEQYCKDAEKRLLSL